MVVLLFVSVLAYGNESNDILLKMSDAQGNDALAKFMAASGERCAKVIRNFYQGFDKRYGAFWNFTCNDGKSYSLMILKDAQVSTRISECSVMQAVGGGQPCFKKF